MNEKEINIFDTDLSSFSNSEKLVLINKHSNYQLIKEKVINVNGSYIANIRTLMLMLFIAMLFSIQKYENRTILLTIISLQFIKSLFSKLLEVGLNESAETAKNDFKKALKQNS